MIPLPVLVGGALVHPRLRRDLGARLGDHRAAVAPGAVWIHASSLGEVAAAEALWHALDGPRLLTTDTRDGWARGRRFAGAATALLPLDHPWTLAPLWADARPRCVVFVEGTWWPALARRAASVGVPVLRVSAKAGQGTRRVPRRLLRRLWSDTTAVAARDEAERAFLAAVHRAPVVALGDLKEAIRPAPSPLVWSRPFVVGASLRAGDAARLVTARPPGHQLLLAPRHREGMAPEAWPPGVWVRRSALVGGRVPPEVDGVVLDTFGELAACIEGAAAVFVGGTFDAAIGGHSPREALAWGVPVVAGPHVGSAPEAFVGASRAHDPEALGRRLLEAVAASRPARGRPEVAVAVAAFVQAHAGPPAPEASPRPFLAPLALPWGLVAELRRRRPRRAERLPVPVISVGSTNARAPGKTSTVRFLVGALQARGHRVGVALRGYGRDRGGRDLRGSWSTDLAADLGDEGALLARCGAVVAAAPDRVVAGRALVARGCTVVLLDDGWLARDLARDIELMVVDARFPRARGPQPMGERRGLEVAPAADVTWVHHGAEGFSAPGVAVARRPGAWTQGGRPAVPPAAGVAFVGVGHPAQVLAGYPPGVMDTWLARDHERPDPNALRAWVGARALFTTAKDAERLPPDLADRAYVRALELQVPELDWLPEAPCTT